MRYFLRLAYKGTNYHGWQRQPHSTSVQQTIEEALGTIINRPIGILGCGRTDTGVHASDYVAHVDLEEKLPDNLLRRLNRMLPDDIAVFSITAAGLSIARPGEAAHARFDATQRAYRYDIIAQKDPFRQNTAWHYHGFADLNVSAMQAAATALLEYAEFAPFCKTKSDAKTMRCDVRRAEWIALPAWPNASTLHFHIAADRFLRGMVRLIVGACVQVGLGQLEVADIHHALQKQQPLIKPLSVPPDGLFLAEVRYPTG